MGSVRRVAVAAVLLLLHTPAFAQVTTADIVGRVIDASGAVLPGVTVTVTNTASFANPIAQVGAAGCGSINSIGNSIPRQMQFALKLLF